MRTTTKLLVFLLSILFGCKTHGDLLWVKNSKKGGPPLIISNFLANEKDGLDVYPLYKLKVSKNNDLIFYKRQKIFDTSILGMNNEVIELYRNSLIFLTERPQGVDLPFSINRKEFYIIDLESPQNYFKVEIEKPIRIIAGDLIEVGEKKGDKNVKIFSPSNNDYYAVKSVDLITQEILFYKIVDQNIELKLPLQKFNNTSLEMPR